MHGSSCSYVPQGFPAMHINIVETGFVSDRTDPTKDDAPMLSPGNSLASRRSSKRFTWPHGGFLRPQDRHVVRPSRVSCLYGTPMITSWRASLPISRHACTTFGMCSKTSAQKTQSKESSENCNLVASPATVVTS